LTAKKGPIVFDPKIKKIFEEKVKEGFCEFNVKIIENNLNIPEQ